MLVLAYAVYARTPFGAIGETLVNVARGQKDRPSWLATFKGRETAVRVDDSAVADASAAQGDLPTPITVAALKHKVDPEALAALMMSSVCTPASCEMNAPPRTSAVLAALAGKAKLTSDEAARALAAGATELDNDPALAIEALWIGPVAVSLAVEQARRSSLADAADVEAHAQFLSPSTRRGPLQGALAVIAVHRLRTLAWPADARFRITSPFGERVHPVTGRTSFHNGTDVGVPSGTPLFAAHQGAVKRRSRDSVSGNYVILDHGLGIETVYCHMTEASVIEGTRVKRKETVGSSGATGRVTGPHLHYILRVREQPIDAEMLGESPTKKGGLGVVVPLPT
jgi:murein DD-endopeptidase MepM/ murein hydrolase activator NlpD